MSKGEMLRALVKQRLTAAAEDIFGLFERTIAEYEETLCRSKEENERQRRLLDAVFNPQLRLHRADIQQEWSPSLDQEGPPEPPHIKEEQEEVWTNQEGEQLHKLEGADVITFTFTPVPVKSEDDDEEKPQSSQLHQRQTDQMETETDGEDCGGPEPDRNSHPDTHLTPDKPGDSSETDVSDCEETREPLSGSKNNVQVSDRRCNVDETSLSCSECGKMFVCKATLKRHMITHTGEKPFRCSECGKAYTKSYGLKRHMRTHTGEKPFGCPDCGKRFGRKEHLIIHIRIHTGERPFSCSVCRKSFSVRDTLQSHMRTHTGQKRFRCTVCDKRFVWCRQLKIHKCTESSQLHHRQTDQRETEAEGEDCGGPEAAWNSELDTRLMTELNPGELS